MDTQTLFNDNTVVERLVPQPQYSCYADLITTGQQIVNTSIFTDMQVLDLHFYQILNILLDGIETEQIQNSILFVQFTDMETVKLSIFDYWVNLLFWGLPVSTGHPISSRYLWFYEDITQDSIAEYINSNFLKINRDQYSNMQINNLIDDVMYKFQFVDKFSLYLYNTANNEDTIDLMKQNKDFWDYVHCDISNVPSEDIKDVSMGYTRKGIDAIIKSGTHWAAPYFRSKEGINPKQFREFMFNIGTVPTDDGTVFSRPINGNFSNRGITDPVDYAIEDSKARQAQILSHQNVRVSGAFARILGLNNLDDRLHDDPNYVCDSKHFVAITIKDAKTLSMYKNRYYRFDPNGIEYKLPAEPLKDSTELIGRTLYFRSPITCASRTRGEGICHRCYGGLAKTNYDINIGQIASELLSALLTQRMLSAKHLLETNVRKITWTSDMSLFFDIYFSSIRLKDDREFKKFRMVIPQESIISDNDEEDMDDAFNFNNYVTSVTIVDPKGNVYTIGTVDEDNLYFSIELDNIISKKSPDADGNYNIMLDDLKGLNIFFIEIVNNELGRTLEKIKNIINKGPDIAKLRTKERVTQALVDAVIEGGLAIDAIHLETILAHQCVSAESTLLDPQWEYPNETYKMVTLHERLKDNPSITISLMYNKVNRLLFYPMTFLKTKASVVDLFFMTKPQNYMSMEPVETNIVNDKEVDGPIKPFTVHSDEPFQLEEDDEE